MNMVRRGLIVATAGAVVAFCTAFPDAYSLPKFWTITLGALIAALGMASTGGRFCAGSLMRPALAFMAAAVFSAMFTRDPVLSVLGRFEAYFYGLSSMFLCFFLYVIASDYRDRVGPIYRAILVAAIFAGLYGALQQVYLEPFANVAQGRLDWGRIITTLGNPVFAGYAFAMTAPIALHYAMREKGGDRELGYWALALCLAGLLFTKSRGAYLAATVSGALYLAHRWLTWRRLALFLPALALAGALAVWVRRDTVIADTFRLEAWRVALVELRESPLVGGGPGTFHLAYREHRAKRFAEGDYARRGHGSAHNDILQVAATMGAIGLAAYLWLVLAVFRLAWSWRPVPSAVAAFCAVLSYFIMSKFNPAPLHATALAVVLVGLHDEPAGRLFDRRPVGVTLAVPLAALLAVLTLFAYAGRCARNGHLAKSVRLHPWHYKHRAMLASELMRLAPKNIWVLPLAERVTRDAIRIHPHHPGAYHMAGQAVGMLGKCAEAKALLRHSLILDPLNAEARNLEAWLYKVCAGRGE